MDGKLGMASVLAAGGSGGSVAAPRQPALARLTLLVRFWRQIRPQLPRPPPAPGESTAPRCQPPVLGFGNDRSLICAAGTESAGR